MKKSLKCRIFASKTAKIDKNRQKILEIDEKNVKMSMLTRKMIKIDENVEKIVEKRENVLKSGYKMSILFFKNVKS